MKTIRTYTVKIGKILKVMDDFVYVIGSKVL